MGWGVYQSYNPGSYLDDPSPLKLTKSTQHHRFLARDRSEWHFFGLQGMHTSPTLSDHVV